jgi:S-adenosylmethionine:tRNA ribosyltransferase-isomerase
MVASGTFSLPTALFDYQLPEERIAQVPREARDASRLLHLPPAPSSPRDHRFRDLPELLRPDDLLVVNQTRVRAARLNGRRPGGGAVELLVLSPLPAPGAYACLVRPARRVPPGTEVALRAGLRARIGEPLAEHPGARVVRVEGAAGDVDAALESAGEVPLPPYIRVPLSSPERYQTVFGTGPPRSAAAPTAGLHFTAAVLERLAARGIAVAAVDLEVGLATFTPIRTERIGDHAVHDERYRIPAETAAAVAEARARGGRVIAVGTTAVRALESRRAADRTVTAGEGVTRLFLHPGAPPLVIDGLLTNFHQPRSSLLVLLASVVGVERWRPAYEHALARGYRFLSFGDCMLCWRETG